MRMKNPSEVSKEGHEAKGWPQNTFLFFDLMVGILLFIPSSF